MARDHRKLRAFVLADALVLAVYEVSRMFPKEEMFGLTAQMRRASVSVTANIVEGCARRGQAEYVNFLNIAFGSLREVGYYLSLAPRLGFITEEARVPIQSKYDETATVMASLINSLS